MAEEEVSIMYIISSLSFPSFSLYILLTTHLFQLCLNIQVVVLVSEIIITCTWISKRKTGDCDNAVPEILY